MKEIIIQWAQDVHNGQRRALAKAITLSESSLPADQKAAELLLDELLPYVGHSYRLGISGVPGAGKSTFIEGISQFFLNNGHKVAILAIDPSSPYSGGSILGDKTRMNKAASHPHCFIRPSATNQILGGVARHTREAILLCEAGGFDIIIVETVGVGQNETKVSEMVDLFFCLLAPGGGDRIQGLKKGIIECSDVILITKADGDLRDEAYRMQSEYQTALGLNLTQAYLNQNGLNKVKAFSNHNIENLADIYYLITQIQADNLADGSLQKKRAEQQKLWLKEELLGQIGVYIQSRYTKEITHQSAKTDKPVNARRWARQFLSTIFLAEKEGGSGDRSDSPLSNS